MKTSVVQKIETYFVITVITVLIWLYAESKNATKDQTTINVQFVAPSGQELMIDPAEPTPVLVTFSSATSKVAEVKKLGSIKLLVPEDTSEPVVLRERLAESPLGELAVIIETDPPTIRVRAEPFETRMLPIKVLPGDIQLRELATADPTDAAVKVPASLAPQLDGIKLEAHLADAIDDLTKFDDNRPHTISVRLDLPEPFQDKPVRIEPAAVSVTFTVSRLTKTTSVPLVPIYVRLPVIESNNYEVIPENDQRVLPEDLELSGPPELIEKINNKEILITAELRLDAVELDSGITSKELWINKPPGVAIDSEIPRLNFTIRKSENGSSP
ncbi:MAG: hypothetical protein V3U29_07885 [Phycisphaeraceae bacterium]